MGKKLLYILFIMLTIHGSYAQTDLCSLPSSFEELYRYGNAKEALELWEKFVNQCKNKSFVEFAKGEEVLLYEYKNATPETRKAKQLQLLAFYQKLNDDYPGQSGNTTAKRILLLDEDESYSKDALLAELHQILFLKNEAIDNPLVLKLYFDSAMKAQKEGTSKNSIYQTVETFLNVKLKAKELQVIYTNKAQEFENLLQYIDTHPLTKEWITCNNLEKFTQTQLESKNADFNTALALAIELNQKCFKSPIFLTWAKQTYERQETSESAFVLGMAIFHQESIEMAIPYLSKAIELDSDTDRKATRAFNLASLYLGINPGQAAAFLKSAIQANPQNPDNYLLFAEIYEASITFCNVQNYEADALHYLASEIVLEAAKVNPKYKAATTKKAASYRDKMKTQPSKNKKNSVELKCWINQKVQW